MSSKSAEKIERFNTLMKAEDNVRRSRGIFEFRHDPPIVILMRKLGFAVKPVYYWLLPARAALFTFQFGLVISLVCWLIFLTEDKGPNMPFERALVFGYIAAFVVLPLGLVAEKFFVRRLNLPRWEDILDVATI